MFGMGGKPAPMRKAMGLVVEDPPVCRLCDSEVPDLPGEKLLVEIGGMEDGAVGSECCNMAYGSRWWVVTNNCK